MLVILLQLYFKIKKVNYDVITSLSFLVNKIEFFLEEILNELYIINK